MRRLSIGQGGRYPSVLLVRLHQRTERLLSLAPVEGSHSPIANDIDIMFRFSYRVNSFVLFGLRAILPWPLTTLAANCMMTASTV